MLAAEVPSSERRRGEGRLSDLALKKTSWHDGKPFTATTWCQLEYS